MMRSGLSCVVIFVDEGSFVCSSLIFEGFFSQSHLASAFNKGLQKIIPLLTGFLGFR